MSTHEIPFFPPFQQSSWGGGSKRMLSVLWRLGSQLRFSIYLFTYLSDGRVNSLSWSVVALIVNIRITHAR